MVYQSDGNEPKDFMKFKGKAKVKTTPKQNLETKKKVSKEMMKHLDKKFHDDKIIKKLFNQYKKKELKTHVKGYQKTGCIEFEWEGIEPWIRKALALVKR